VADIIDTAGRLGPVAQKPDLRREAVRRVREVLRRQDAPDAEVEDALEALIELAKD
jgi:hypothetical protein